MRTAMDAETARRDRSRLADRLVSHRAEIERRWLARRQAQPTGGSDGGADAMTSPLRPALPDYLAALARGLVGSATLEEEAAAAWRGVARDHALTPRGDPFDVDGLVRDLILLRQAIADGVEEAAQTAVAAAVEVAIAESVRSYVEARDQATRHAQAQHGAFVSHELRNPLTTALVITSQLRRTNGTGPAGPRLVLLERSLLRLRHLIDGALAAERDEGPEPQVQRTDLSLGELVDEALAPAHTQAQERGLELVVQIDPDLALHVDRALSVAALQNMVENALRFTDEGRVEVTSEDRREEVALHVHDSCKGVGKAELAIIFEPFRRTHDGRAVPGYGLAVARRAIEAQGGAVGAESSPNQGCHFWLTLQKAHN